MKKTKQKQSNVPKPLQHLSESINNKQNRKKTKANATKLNELLNKAKQKQRKMIKSYENLSKSTKTNKLVRKPKQTQPNSTQS